MLVFRIVSVFAPNHVDQGLEELVPCTYLVFVGRGLYLLELYVRPPCCIHKLHRSFALRECMIKRLNFKFLNHRGKRVGVKYFQGEHSRDQAGIGKRSNPVVYKSIAAFQS